MTAHYPLYPQHGEEYTAAMKSACDEYLRWLDENSMRKGIHVYSRTTSLDFSGIDIEAAQVFE